MANISKACLSDKDIELLEIRDKRYFVVVGNPKELEIYINPKGSKVFFNYYLWQIWQKT